MNNTHNTSVQPRLSIIIPFYNVEQYIAQCLDSVYNQDIPEDEYEVICVDDCSPDNSIKIVERYADKHSNLVIVRNATNRKLGGARNAGMEVARGNYVWFVDSDDFILPNIFNKFLSIAEENELDMLHFNYAEYPRDVVNIKLQCDTSVTTGSSLFFSSDFIWAHDLVTAWRKIYNRHFLLENHIHFAEHIMYEDNDYAIMAFAYANKVKHVVTKAYYYRNNPESITHVKQTSEHIAYWLNLCHRLVALKERLVRDKRDPRFIPLIDDFIRYHIHNVLDVYRKMDVEYKFDSRKIIYRDVDFALKPYTSRKEYLKIKLHLL